MIEIDGSMGEGGGQIIRSSLALSLATGRPFRMWNIRSGRKRPGLLRQHLTAVQAAATIGNAQTTGDKLHSRDLVFEPGTVTPGEYSFSIGTAGSASLVMQTVLPVLLFGEAPSTLRLEGGTHNPHAPPFDFIETTYLPIINRLGPKVTATLDRPGFYPAGGGKFRVTVQPAARLDRLELHDRGRVREVRARAIVSQLPRHIAERELTVVSRELGMQKNKLELIEETRARGPGNVVVVEINTDSVTEIVTAFGEKGVPAERVAAAAVREAQTYIETDVPVGPHLADQLLLPLALGSGGSYVTIEPTEHTLTNIDVIRRFLDVTIAATSRGDGTYLIEVQQTV